MNIPIYRAKKIGSDEYVVGNYIKTQNKYYIYEEGTSDIYLDDEECFNDGSIDGEIRIIELIFEIDPTTIAIHFPDMLDSQGNKIFASLDKYYIKGADIITNDNFSGEYSLQVAIYSEGCFYVQDKDGELYNLCENWEKLKVIGIQE